MVLEYSVFSSWRTVWLGTHYHLAKRTLSPSIPQRKITARITAVAGLSHQTTMHFHMEDKLASPEGSRGKIHPRLGEAWLYSHRGWDVQGKGYKALGVEARDLIHRLLLHKTQHLRPLS